jgi:hypothetical protein
MSNEGVGRSLDLRYESTIAVLDAMVAASSEIRVMKHILSFVEKVKDLRNWWRMVVLNIEAWL